MVNQDLCLGRSVSSDSGTLWEMTRFSQVITLIGAGGKTTTLRALTKEIHARGQKVIATTTTKTYPLPFETVWVNLFLSPPVEMTYPCFWYSHIDVENNKWIGPTVDTLDEVLSIPTVVKKAARVWVIEGDGAREKKLKCWAPHEPQIPLKSACAILVISGDLWNKFLSEEKVHRSEKCFGLVGKVWTEKEAAEYLLNSPVFYPQYQEFQWIVLFNEYESNDCNFDKNEFFDFEENNLESNTPHFLIEYLVKYLSRDLQQKVLPAHLRIASGNVKGGQLRWYDLW